MDAPQQSQDQHAQLEADLAMLEQQGPSNNVYVEHLVHVLQRMLRHMLGKPEPQAMAQDQAPTPQPDDAPVVDQSAPQHDQPTPGQPVPEHPPDHAAEAAANPHAWEHGVEAQHQQEHQEAVDAHAQERKDAVPGEGEGTKDAGKADDTASAKDAPDATLPGGARSTQDAPAHEPTPHPHGRREHHESQAPDHDASRPQQRKQSPR